ncbi:MAG: threonine aldolase family protein [Acidimicrobiales bacterium]
MNSGLVDLRSDTVTRPTALMRKAMYEAEVGDDVYGEDPTVVRLEERFAARVGKSAALYVPSGVMANQLALRLLAQPSRVVIAGRRQHVVAYEDGAAAVNSGVQFHTLPDEDGTISPAGIRWAIEAASHHMPKPSLVCLENTHMAASGMPWHPADLEVVLQAAGELPVYMDGARLFNAEVATGISAAGACAGTAAVMCCMSKGLCAPVGSLLGGDADFIAEARIERHRLGGAMRQAGIIAAAGLVALETMVDRLAEDHSRAKRLAEAIATRWPDAGCDPDRVLTNIVVFTHSDPPRLFAHFRSDGVLAGTIAPDVVRLVTHNDIDDEGMERARVAIGSAP